MRPRVIEIEAEPGGQAFGDGCLQGVVVGHGVVIAGLPADLLILGVRPVGVTVRRRDFPQRDLVDIHGKGQVVGVTGHIGDLSDHAASERALDSQIPLHDLGIGLVILCIGNALPVQRRRIGVWADKRQVGAAGGKVDNGVDAIEVEGISTVGRFSAQSAVTVSTDAVVIDIHAESAADGRRRFRRPGESQTRQDIIPYRRLQGSSAIGVGRSEPHGAERAGGGVEDGGVEALHVLMDFIPAMLDFVPHSQIQREVGHHLVVVLDKELRCFVAAAEFRRNTRSPVTCVPDQEVGIARSSCGVPCILLGVGIVAAEVHGRGIQVAPGGGVVDVHQEFTPEAQDMLAANHGENVGRSVRELLQDRIGPRGKTVVTEDINSGKDVGFGELQSDFLRIVLVESGVFEKDEPCVEAVSGFIDGLGADVPDIRDLRRLVFNVNGLAGEGAAEEA